MHLSDHSLILLFIVTSTRLTQVLGSCSYILEAFVFFTLFQLLNIRGGPVFVCVDLDQLFHRTDNTPCRHFALIGPSLKYE